MSRQRLAEAVEGRRLAKEALGYVEIEREGNKLRQVRLVKKHA
jgi:hypothetical protein